MENKAFVGGAWSASEDNNKHQNDATFLMKNEELLNLTRNLLKLLKEKRVLEEKNSKLSSKIDDLETEVKKHANDKEVVEACQKCVELTQEVDSLKCNVSKLQDEALIFLKFKESSIALDNMLSRQKLSQDKKGLGFSKNDQTTSASPNKSIVFVCLRCNLRPNDWIVDSGCTKHMTRNRRLFTSYKEYDDGHVVFGSNLKGKVVGGDDRIDEPIVQDLNGSPSLQVNILDEGYPKSLKEARDHPIEQDFASWQQRIRLYCRGKENGVNIVKSIDEGPFRMGTLRETLTEGTEGALHLGPERPRVYSDLTSKEKDRYNANIRAINILLQGLPKDIYSLINHYTDAKDIWDNVKMLLEGSELTKEDRASQLYDDFEHFRQHKGETIHY
uniref:Integrase, catalytic region, zinc finger, CCHC-type, peptidase aspartic, catalytic n=1 Tax=Tanacetum cinerariifolium TaxID=118510 RepID=A0A699GN72_TANCI|nr:integrase, catalytic region, zinc finger, CCHC-type, peptidase aspartic, catalytic [Tanacetum cinerariifolium]